LHSICAAFDRTNNTDGVKPTTSVGLNGTVQDTQGSSRTRNLGLRGRIPLGFLEHTRRLGSRAAFTMVEIALCIAIIGFALVAVIGVLPTAMRVQQDNRADTLIDQDGNYFMEAIRHGAQGIDDITNYLKNPPHFVYTDINRNLATNPPTPLPFLDARVYDTGRKIIGLLSAPRTNNDDFRVEAEFRAISGAAIEKDPSVLVNFEYLLVSEVIPFSAFDIPSAFGPVNSTDPNAVTNMARALQRNMYEVRLTFRWPLLRNGNVGNNRKVFRTLVSGFLANEPEPFWPYYFYFQPTAFVPNQLP
jgi:type II secretory pathway pseudopilin PulG